MLFEHKNGILRLDIGWIAHAKNVENSAVFLRAHGFTMRQTRSLTQPGGIKLVQDKTIQRICEAAVCTPNDLFRFTGSSKSHLAVLNASAPTRPGDFLKHIPQSEIDALMEKVEKLMDTPPDLSAHSEGSLRLNVARLVEQRQQVRPQAFLRHMGFTAMEARKLFDPNRKAFKVSMLTRLCLLFSCLPNDLFDWEGSENHHLNVLRKSAPPNLTVLLSKLSPEQAQAFLRQLR